MNKVKEQTFLLLKPDAVQRGFVGRIISRFEEKGFKIVALKMLIVSQEQAARHYECHKEKPFYASLVSFITSAPTVAMVIEGDNAISISRKMMGVTSHLESIPGTIRGDYALDMRHNLIHGSDSLENYRHEVSVYFTAEEILTYGLIIENWIYPSK